jgi:ribose transport system substrate-binding protein
LQQGKNAGKFTIVASQPADYDRTKALQVTENVLQANDIAVIYAANDEMALGAARAVDEAGLAGKVAIVGNDGTADAIEAVKNGTMAATIATPGYLQGFIAVSTALHHLNGKAVPDVIPEKSTPITKENVEDAESVLHGTEPEQRYWEALYGE